MSPQLVEAAETDQHRVGGLVADVVADVLGPGRTRLVALGMSRDEHPKVTVLAFPDGSAAPALVVKVALSPNASTAVRREAAALRLVAGLDPTRLGGTVPRYVELRIEPACTVLATSACPGLPMSTDYHRWRHTASASSVRTDFETAAGWLTRLGRLECGDHPTTLTGPGTATLAGPDTPWLPTDWPTRIRERWPGDEVAARVADETATRLERLGEPRRVDSVHVVHGDFWCGNILRHGGRVTGVVDWEHTSYDSDPLRDRTRFALAYALYLDRHTRPGRTVAGHPGLRAGAWGEPVRYLLGGSGWFLEVVAGFLGDGLRATGRNPALWRDALLVGLAEVAALSDHAGFARQHLDLAGEVSR